MGILRRVRDGWRLTLPARCLVGRSPQARLIIDERFASAEHARIQWSDNDWELRDLGSTNGTFVAGQRLEPGRPARLSAGMTLGFGENEGWTFADDAPPVAMAIDVQSREVIEGTREMLLLSAETPIDAVSVYRAPRGSGWLREDAEGTVDARDGEVLAIAGRRLRLELPGLVEATPMAGPDFSALESITFRFVVSRDEEHVAISMIRARGSEALERKWFGYFLLTLARARRKDQALSPEERGWCSVDELSKMLKLDPSSINVATHEARRFLEGLGVEGAAGIVDVRRGQRRFGTERFEIEEQRR